MSYEPMSEFPPELPPKKAGWLKRCIPTEARFAFSIGWPLLAVQTALIIAAIWLLGGK